MPSIIRTNAAIDDHKLFVQVVKNILHHEANFPAVNAGLFQSLKQSLFSDSPAKHPLTDNTLSFNSFLLNTIFGSSDNSAVAKYKDVDHTPNFASFWFNGTLSLIATPNH